MEEDKRTRISPEKLAALKKIMRNKQNTGITSTGTIETRTVVIDMPVEQFEKISQLAKIQGITATSALAKAIETEFYIKEQIGKGARILVQNPDRSIREIAFK